MRSARAGSSTSTVWKMTPTRTADGSRPASAAPARMPVDRRGDVRRVSSHAQEDAVGAAARHAQGARAAGGDPDRHRPVVGQMRRPGRPDVDPLAVQQRAHQERARLQLLDARRAEPRQPDRGVAHAPAEQGAAGRQLVDRRDGRRRHGGMPVHRVGQERPEGDALGRPRGRRQQHVGVAAAKLGIRLERGVPAQRLGAAHVGREGVDGAAVEPVQSEARHRHGAVARTFLPTGVSSRWKNASMLPAAIL